MFRAADSRSTSSSMYVSAYVSRVFVKPLPSTKDAGRQPRTSISSRRRAGKPGPLNLRGGGGTVGGGGGRRPGGGPPRAELPVRVNVNRPGWRSRRSWISSRSSGTLCTSSTKTCYYNGRGARRGGRV